MPTLVSDIPINDGAQSPNYTGLAQSHNYSYDPGYIILPLADGGYSKIRLHSGIGSRNTVWSETKRDNPPVVPKAEDLSNPSGETTAEILGAAIMCGLPCPSPDGNGFDWTISGTYTYILTSPNEFDGTEGLPLGNFPMNSTMAQFGIGSSSNASGLGTGFYTFNPDDATIDIPSGQYSWPWLTKFGKQFFSTGMIRG